MRLHTIKSSVGRQEIESAVVTHMEDMHRKRRLKAYYNGKHSIMSKQARTNTEVNNRLVANYPAYISNISTGFFIGQPVTYKSADEEGLKRLLDIYKYNDEQAHNVELAEESSVTGEAYEILYLDGDAQIRLAAVPSEEIILITDATLEEAIKAAIRHYRIYEPNLANYSEYVDVYDPESVTHYAYSGNLRELSRESHYFGDVPIIEYANNRTHKGDFEDVLTLIDAYNKAQSLTLDDLEDFTDAFLILKGLGGTTPEDVKELRRNKVILVEEGGSAEWLIKNLNDTYVENIKSRLQKDIHKFSAIPDMSDESFSGNTSGVAIKYKLIGLEQIRSRKEREFKKALQRRIELISNVLTLKGQQAIDFRAVEIQFTANIPANVAEIAEIVTKLDGVVSAKTLLGLLPFVTDAAAEIEDLREADY